MNKNNNVPEDMDVSLLFLGIIVVLLGITAPVILAVDFVFIMVSVMIWQVCVNKQQL